MERALCCVGEVPGFGFFGRVKVCLTTRRFDLSLQFEEFLGDTEGVDRVIATGVYTFRVTDKFSIPITLQYANRSEFIDEDSDQLSANVGFKYDLNFGN